MTYSDIYSQALTFTGETADSTAVSDFNSRADYLLPAVVARLSNASLALGTSPSLPSGKIVRSATFPLDPRLSVAAAALLASLFVASEQPELSERLAEFAADSVACAAPADSAPTREVY